MTYQVRPEALDEHVSLIRAVFDELSSKRPANLEYKVLCLDDGVSFVHVSTADTSDGANPLPELESFRQFGKELPDRVATQPNPTAANIIGSYQPTGEPLE